MVIMMMVVSFNETMQLLFSRTGRAGNKGHAYTFINSGQARSAGDIIKALESSGMEVAPSIRKLWEDYKKEQEAVSIVINAQSNTCTYVRYSDILQ